MGFALWIDKDLAWAQGTHEYRPMGAAVVSSTSVFAARDFAATRLTGLRPPGSFQGLFASLGHLNRHLSKRQSQAITSHDRRTLSCVRTIL